MSRRPVVLSALLPRLLVLLAGVFTLAPASAEVRLPSVISDHMVLQRDAEVRIWGWAEPGEKVTVQLVPAADQAEKDGQLDIVETDAQGNWSVMLSARPSGANWQLRISGNQPEKQIVITDIVFGEVWVASGQSNMEWSVANSNNAAQEIADSTNPQIRMWTAKRTVATEPQDDVPGQWLVAGPGTTGRFSAVAYFFARDLHDKLGVPVGILHASWGGTPVEGWTSRDKLEATEVAAPILERFGQAVERYDQAKTEYQQQLQRFEETRNGPPNTGFDAGFAKPDFDDAQWEPFPVPARWEDHEMHVDGVVWFRRTVDIPADWAGKQLVLELGPIDDGDTTYWNNQQVGSTRADRPNSWQSPRSYRIPADQVKAGVATLAVRVVDISGYGGMYGQAASLRIYPADGNAESAINLAGNWKHHIAHQIDPRNAVTSAPRLPYGPEHPHSPAGLYNGMIAPIVPYTIRGALWYQGEHNAPRAEQYETLFPALIQDWRDRWGQGEFPFLFVQLANFHAPADEPTDTDWSHLRDAQLKTLREVPNTGMATIIDIGEANDIHPKNKQDVGSRLARWALHHTYEQKDVVASGPIYIPGSFDPDMNAANVQFETFGSPLSIRGEEHLQGFTIAGEDNVFVPANAALVHDENGRIFTVKVWADQVKNPVAVRYAWKDNPVEANLVNEEGLPASPFRTDDLPGPTDGRR